MMKHISKSALAADGSKPAPPYFNPNWAASSYPTVHPMGDASPIAGPTGPSRRLRRDEIRHAAVPSAYAGLYSSPYPDGKRVLWAGGYDRIAKLDPDTLEVLTAYSLGGRTVFGETEANRTIARLDSIKDDRKAVEFGVKASLEQFEVINTTYRVLSNKNELYIPYRGEDGVTSIRVYGDEDPNDRNSRIRLRREWKVPPEISRSSLCGLNMTSDGTIVFTIMDGTMVALPQDFSSYSVLKLPAKDDAARTHSAKFGEDTRTHEDFLDTFVRNNITIDDRNGIYVVSRDYLYRVQLTGAKLSLDEADGAWKAGYPNSSGRGSGTSPIIMGWGPNEDHLVIITDGSVKNNAMVFWRDDIPADWKPLPDMDRRVAGITPVTFGVSSHEPLQLELAPTVWGYGAFFVQPYMSDTETTPLASGNSPSEKWLGMAYGFHIPGHQARGGAKIEWDPKKRTLGTTWRTQANFLCTLGQLSTTTGIFYWFGVRNRVFTLEGLDWQTGKSAFHYTLGRSNRYNSMASAVALAPDGAVLGMNCGWGLLRVKPASAPAKGRAP